jgi:predicted lactoylglutathione lyase|tara:strand:+ start:199 stop:357 length:159 start_codon:yes stop_codon:yes gene_type:complete
MIWANLGVESIAKTQKFYCELGFNSNGEPNEELVSFIFSDNNFIFTFSKRPH